MTQITLTDAVNRLRNELYNEPILVKPKQNPVDKLIDNTKFAPGVKFPSMCKKFRPHDERLTIATDCLKDIQEDIDKALTAIYEEV